MNRLTRPFLRLEVSPLNAILLSVLLLAAVFFWLRPGSARPRPGAAPVPGSAAAGCDPCAAYLELMKYSLTDLLYESDIRVRNIRYRGLDWPGRGYTMIGIPRLNNLQQALEDVIARKVPGDVIEAGAWRGGATMFMRALLKCRGADDRTVWVADSFEGLPATDPAKYPADEGWNFNVYAQLAVSLENVQTNFARYGLLDDHVRFLKGWFKDTLKDAPIRQLAVLRVDADLYESTTDALNYLYPKVSRGGYVIIDDYVLLPPCKKAVDDFRSRNSITSRIVPIDEAGAYWIRE